MKRRRAKHTSGRKRMSFMPKRLLVEVLESRTLLALLTPGSFAEAYSDFQGIQVGPVSNSDPTNAVAEAISGPLVNLPGLVFQESGYAEATTPGPVLGRSLSGGIFPNANPSNAVTCSTTTGRIVTPARLPTNPAATVSCSTATATNNWIVSGVPSGTMVDVDVEVQIAGNLQTLRFGGPSVSSSVVASLSMASNLAPDAALFAAEARMTNSQLTTTGPWSFSQVPGQQARYETNHTSTLTFTFPAVEPFSLQAALSTIAESAGPFESFAYSDFSATGVTYTLSTSTPGASIIQAGGGGVVEGFLWQDENADGVENPGESREFGLAGFRFYLDQNSNGQFDPVEPATFTDQQGEFQMTGIAPGTYDLRLDQVAGWEQTTPVDASGNAVSVPITVMDSTLLRAPDFGARRIRAEVNGVLWHDQNEDGVRDSAEPVFAGWTVYDDANRNGRPELGERAVVSDAMGRYVLSDLRPGTRYITAAPPTVWGSDTNGQAVVLRPGEIVTRDIGFREAGEVTGTLFVDSNFNGQFDVGEPPQAGWQVFIDANDNGFLETGERSTRTDVDGRYTFNLAPGDYTIAVMIQYDNQWQPTTPGQIRWAMDSQPSTSIISGRFSRDITPADFNNDGVDDLLLVTYVLNADGIWHDDGVTIALNSVTDPGNFLSAQLYRPGPAATTFVDEILGVLDLNDDGLLDLVLSTYEVRNGFKHPLDVGVMYNQPASPGTFSPFEALIALDGALVFTSPRYQAANPLITDLNSDGLPDIVFSKQIDSETAQVQTLFNHGSGFLPIVVTQIDAGPSGLDYADLNQDGYADLVQWEVDTATMTDELVVHLADPFAPGNFTETRRGAVPGGRDRQVADVNMDGVPDLVSLTAPSLLDRTSTAPSELWIALGDPVSPGSFGAPTSQAVAVADNFRLADLNNDSYPDIVAHGLTGSSPSRSNDLYVLLNDPTSPGTYGAPTTYATMALFPSEFEWTLADLNSDGFLDILANALGPAPGEDASFPVLLNVGDGTFGTELYDGGDMNRGDFDLADLNGDGLTDFAHLTWTYDTTAEEWRHQNLRININNPNQPGALDSHVALPIASEALDAVLVDLNHDGKPDFINHDLNQPRLNTVINTSSISTRATVALGTSITWNVGFQEDADRDGVLDGVEAAGPNGGDINSDGTRDDLQANVASLPNSTDGSYVGFASPPGTTLSDVRATPVAPNMPANVTFPDGHFTFRVEGVTPGGAVDVLMFRESSALVSDYYKFGPTTGDPTDHWYQFHYVRVSPDPSISGTGAEVAPTGNVTVLHFVDGRRGDSDLTANGVIVDPGGPATRIQPTLRVEGPASGVRGQPLEFQFNVSPLGDYTYDIDWDGNGTTEKSLVASETLILEHTFDTVGDFSVQVTVTDRNSVSSNPITHDVSISIAAVVDGNLLVGGTADHDSILFYRWRRHEVRVRVNRDRLGPFSLAPDSRLIAFGLEGNDRIRVSTILPHDVAFFGGPGNDTIRGGRGNDLLDGGPGRDYLFGFSGDDVLDGGEDDDNLFGVLGNNILIGAAGNDHLYGGWGRDLLIGGNGRDWLFGGFGQDILIAGTTTYDNDHQALREVLAEWTLPLSYVSRVERLRDTSRPVYLRKDDTVLDDDSIDRLFGGSGNDWYFFEPDQDKKFG